MKKKLKNRIVNKILNYIKIKMKYQYKVDRNVKIKQEIHKDHQLNQNHKDYPLKIYNKIIQNKYHKFRNDIKVLIFYI